MSTTTATFDHTISAPVTEAKVRAARKGFWQWLMRARELEGRAKVRATFRLMSDQQLKDIGLNPDDVRFVRAQGTLPLDFWA